MFPAHPNNQNSWFIPDWMITEINVALTPTEWTMVQLVAATGKVSIETVLSRTIRNSDELHDDGNEAVAHAEGRN